MHVTRVFDAFAASPSGFDLRLALLAVVLSYAIFRYLQHCLEYRSETAYGIQNSCQPITATIPYRWPGGLDLLKRQYDANAAQELLAYQTPILEKFGPNLEIKLFGNSGYITLDPLNVEAVLSTRFKDYGLGSRSDGLFRFLGEGIFTQDGNKWRHSRELLRRPFMRIPYQNLEGFKEHLDDIISTLSTFAKKGATVDLQPLFFRFTLATTTALIFGQPVKSFDGEEQNSFSNGFDYASMISGLRIRLADLYFLYTPSRFKQACSDVRKYAFDFVQQALADTGNDNGVRDSKYAFIRDLYDELKDPELVRDQLVHVLIAGRDTTACLLSWTL
ncbi:MAG: hypothetical protein LQ342_001713 [Letrouitia transgressa]|nr:MAG: hypothetical protein LQ342_001713 [Letrouitia transgressa]